MVQPPTKYLTIPKYIQDAMRETLARPVFKVSAMVGGFYETMYLGRIPNIGDILSRLSDSQGRRVTEVRLLELAHPKGDGTVALVITESAEIGLEDK